MMVEALYMLFNNINQEYYNILANTTDETKKVELYAEYEDIFEDYKYYHKFFSILYNNITEKIKQQQNVSEIYKIGLGLRALFFTSPEIMVDNQISIPFSTFISNLKNYISGYIDWKEDDSKYIVIGLQIVNEVFKTMEIMEKQDDEVLNPENILSTINKLRESISTQIISDRYQIINPDIKSSIGGKKHKVTKKIIKKKYRKFTKYINKKQKKHSTRKRQHKKQKKY
jgi:hypothetical protein